MVSVANKLIMLSVFMLSVIILNVVAPPIAFGLGKVFKPSLICSTLMIASYPKLFD